MAYESLNYLKSVSFIDSVQDLSVYNAFSGITFLSTVEKEVYSPQLTVGSNVRKRGRRGKPLQHINTLSGIAVVRNISELLSIDETKRKVGTLVSVVHYDENEHASTTADRRLLIHTASISGAWGLSDFMEVNSSYVTTQKNNPTDIYIDATNGSDDYGLGTETYPFKSIVGAFLSINPNLFTFSINVHLSADSYTITQSVIDSVYKSAVKSIKFFGTRTSEEITLTHDGNGVYSGQTGMTLNEYAGKFLGDGKPVYANSDTLVYTTSMLPDEDPVELITNHTTVVIDEHTYNGLLSFNHVDINLTGEMSVSHLNGCNIYGGGVYTCKTLYNSNTISCTSFGDEIIIDSSHFDNTTVTVNRSAIIQTSVARNIVDEWLRLTGNFVSDVELNVLCDSVATLVRADTMNLYADVIDTNGFSYLVDRLPNGIQIDVKQRVPVEQISETTYTRLNNEDEHIHVFGLQVSEHESNQTTNGLSVGIGTFEHMKVTIEHFEYGNLVGYGSITIHNSRMFVSLSLLDTTGADVPTDIITTLGVSFDGSTLTSLGTCVYNVDRY